MYEGHFHLERRPFAATPDPGCCYLSPTQAPLFKSVVRCIENGQGIAILTGPAGIGKTLLVQVLLAESAQRFTTVYLGTGQFPTRRALLQAILYELGQPYGGMTDQELRLELNTALRNLITQRDGLLLVLDEAHLLSDRLLEEVRLLADLAQHGVPLLRVVLSGNPEFEERLTAPALAAFNQRVACHVALETLTQQESIQYLEYRIAWAGGDAERLFEREALRLVAYASDGIPRCLNQLADHSLMQAFLAGADTVSASIVRQALEELQHLPLRWNPSALHDRSSRQSVTPIELEPAAPSEHSRGDWDNPAEVIEVGSADDRETACFEFGAGDDHRTSVPVESTETEACRRTTDDDCESFADLEPGKQSAEVDLDDDGPPLFPWLAKRDHEPAELNSDQYGSSSFRIPARRQARAAVVEQEYVSTAPLTGDELVRARQPLRAAATRQLREIPGFAALPAEESVVDTYAQLDAPFSPSFPRPAPALPVIEIPTPTSIAAEAAATEPTVALSELPERPQPTSQPLERIDAIFSLLEESENVSRGAAGVELITDYGVERVDVDLLPSSELPSGVRTEHRLPIDLEDWIGSTVVEVGRDLQRDMAASFPELVDRPRANQLEQLLEGIQRATQYDVVEPSPAESSTMTRLDRSPQIDAETGTAAGVVPAPKHRYQNFFSQLRRRTQR